MECSQERSMQLMEYAEGNLPAEEAAEMEMHLSSCDSCRQELASWRRLEAELRIFPLVAEPVGLKAAVMSQVTRPPRVVPVVYRPVDPVAALALGAVLLGLGTLFSGIADWEWQIDPSYLASLAWSLLGTAADAGTDFALSLLASLAQVTYSGLTDSAPILMAALLLALFALGPSEIVRTLSPQKKGEV